MPKPQERLPSDFLTAERQDSVLILKMKGDFFSALTDLSQIETITRFFTRLSRDTELKTVIIHPFFQNAGVEEYLQFFGQSKWRNINALHRFYNVIDQMLISLSELDKIVIHTAKGDILSIFMNIGLACDYRIIADDTRFHHAFPRRGMLPKGGGPYFLSRLLGPGKAMELLLLQPAIDATTARAHGIVDRVVPRNELEQEALSIARQFSAVPHQTLAGVKRLVNFGRKELSAYLAFESGEIGQIIRCKQIADL